MFFSFLAYFLHCFFCLIQLLLLIANLVAISNVRASEDEAHCIEMRWHKGTQYCDLRPFFFFPLWTLGHEAVVNSSHAIFNFSKTHRNEETRRIPERVDDIILLNYNIAKYSKDLLLIKICQTLRKKQYAVKLGGPRGLRN